MFYIDLEKRKPEIFEYTQKIMNEDKSFFGVSDIMELSDYDFKIFKTEKEAEKYLKKYMRVLNSLDNAKICKDRKLPNLLYKRRYIVQTLLGEKLQTFRTYNKGWQKGQLFNLYDQTYFLTVKLVGITEIKKDFFEYKFKLIK